MANISKVNFNGNDLDVKDAYAREQILHKTADNYIADVTGDYTINAGDITMTSANTTMHTTADHTIDTDGNDSVHIDGASTLNVGGLRTETFAGDKTEAVTGTTTERAGNRNTTVTGKWMVNTPTKNFNMADIATETDVSTAVNAEAQARETAINAEAKTRADADAALNARIDNIGGGEKRTIIALGDSLGSGITGATGPKSDYGWLKMLRAKAATTKNLTVYTNLDVIIEGNAGFASSAPFLTQIQQIVSNNNINPNDITDIVIFSGSNDCPFIDTTLENALDDFFSYVKTTFTNADVKIGTLIAIYKSAKLGTSNSLPHTYRIYAEKYGYKYIPDVFNLCLRKKFVQSDSTHLSDEGYKTIYPYILECALNGSTKYGFYGFNTYESNVTTYFYVTESGINLAISLAGTASSTYFGNVYIEGDSAIVREAPITENILCAIPNKRVCPVLIKMNNEFQFADYYMDDDNRIHVSLTKSPGAPVHSGTAILMAGGSLNYVSSFVEQD